MISRVDPVLGMPLHYSSNNTNSDENDDEISFSVVESLPNPYLHYGLEGSNNNENDNNKQNSNGEKMKKKSSTSGSSSSRAGGGGE